MSSAANSSGWTRFLQRWVVNTLAVLVATYMVSGIESTTVLGLFVAALVLGVLNSILRPLLLLLSLPLLIFTLGLFTLVINALLLWLVGWLLAPYFTVDGFWPAFWGALIISIVSIVINSLTGSGSARVEVRTGRTPPKPPDRDDRGGPVIDV